MIADQMGGRRRYVRNNAPAVPTITTGSPDVMVSTADVAIGLASPTTFVVCCAASATVCNKRQDLLIGFTCSKREHSLEKYYRNCQGLIVLISDAKTTLSRLEHTRREMLGHIFGPWKFMMFHIEF